MKIKSKFRFSLFLFLLFVCGILILFAQKDDGNLTGGEDFTLRPVSFLLKNWQSKRGAEFNFSLENKKNEPFDQLKSDDVSVVIDNGTPIKLDENALQLTDQKPTDVFVLVDGSLSMQDLKKKGLDKLVAAKTAIPYLINKFGKNDSIAIYAFDTELYEVVPKTTEKESILDKISNFTPRAEFSSSTDLYSAVESIIQKAKQEKVNNIIVVSDGMQDTPEARELLKANNGSFENYKSLKEKNIRENALKAGVNIFSIPIGNKDSTPAHPSNLEYVDYDTLCNIANKAAGGDCTYIDLPKLQTEATESKNSYQSQLEGELKKILDKIRKSISYSYSLSVPLENLPQDNQDHLLKISVKTLNPGKTLQKIHQQTYKLNWKKGTDVPVPVDSASTAEVRFLDFQSIYPLQLAMIYFPIAGTLGFLAFIPFVIGKLREKNKEKHRQVLVDEKVKVLSAGSSFIGKNCLNRDVFEVGQSIVECPNPSCRRPYHLDCWIMLKERCAIKGCRTPLPIPAETRRIYKV